MSTPTYIDHINLHKKILRMRKRYEKLNEEIRQSEVLLSSICPHSETYMKNDYYPGGYLHVSESVTRKICSLCNKELSKKSEMGGYE